MTAGELIRFLEGFDEDDVIHNSLLSVEEYAEGISAPVREVQRMVVSAKPESPKT